MSSGESFKYIRHNLDGSAIATYVLIILIVPLKIACRISNGVNNLGWDDALAVVSLIMANSVFYNDMFGVFLLLSRTSSSPGQLTESHRCTTNAWTSYW